ncbi:hypothetical protein KM911_11460 [Bacillus paralicheniformis]|uniref:hypothetical protein n=1 Tax=Bacillus TaxID=1386 RepID=UPI001C24C634|nr:hypothetical protein [Bacillus paralicheniformis]MBU8582326.1 hypothetical protein [Bacillus paralicheniformis]UAY71100.1 hypothetical protein K8336_03220 [Bacillus paralicheniformis]
MSKRVVSIVATVLSFVLFLAFTMPSVSYAFASSKGTLSVEKDKYISILDALENSIVKKGSGYEVDTKVAQDFGLNAIEITNLKEFVKSSSSQQIEKTLKEVPQAKEQAKKEKTTTFEIAGFKEKLTAAMYAVFVTLCGVTLAQQFISDMYEYGAYKACHALGKKHKSIKEACKITGHW